MTTTFETPYDGDSLAHGGAPPIAALTQRPETGEDPINQVQAACRRFESLAAGEASAPRRSFHRTVAAIHDLCLALDDAESAGVPPPMLHDLVKGARDVHARSPFIRRLQEWPRGYPGDFETIEQLWLADNRAAAGTFAHVLEAYALTASISQQHRNKVALQASWMRGTLREARPCRVLSIGCGSCPDVRSVVDEVHGRAEFVLCDGDTGALEYSRSQLAPIAERCRFIQGMVPRVLRGLAGRGRYDLILAGGLFDYLSDRFIVRTLHDAWHGLLAPGGRIAFTNIARGNPFRVWLEYIASWPLIERSESDLVALCRAAEIPVAPTITRDATGLSLIVTIESLIANP